MDHSQEGFLKLVEEAHSGEVQLPSFQRDWKWERRRVLSLYDSLRKGFPIGNFLMVRHSRDVNLVPRLFEGACGGKDATRLVLDGQQRLTAGISLVYGLGNTTRYFLNLKEFLVLADRYNEEGLNIENDDDVREFVLSIDDGDNYILATTRNKSDDELLMEEHLLSTRTLVSAVTVRRTLRPFLEQHPEYSDFASFVLDPYFVLENTPQCPVITLGESESLSSITQIFSTLNTSSKPLTPIEIVTAVLFADDINLRDQVDLYREASSFLSNMDRNGEVLLQTIALFAGQSPKKSLLPRTITKERFKAYYEDASDTLDQLGAFLSETLGVGLDQTNKLLPYDSILAPMALVVHGKIEKISELPDVAAKLQRWFIGAALKQQYQEGVHNKQGSDGKSMQAWLDGDGEPSWLANAIINPGMRDQSPNGAVGRLLKCLMNRKTPIDPIEKVAVGYFQNAVHAPQYHHVWPKKFCEQHVGGWNSSSHKHNVALNIIPVVGSTNRRWDKMDPANQILDVEAKLNDVQRKQFYDSVVLSGKCIEILKRPDKTAEDYLEFLDARLHAFAAVLAEWEFQIAETDEELASDLGDEDSD